jgi:aminoglycoside phosphotransferase (APT) family kinase protein
VNQTESKLWEAAGPGGAGLGPWLERNLPGLTPPFAAVQVGRGRSNLTFRITDAVGTAVVLRRPRSGATLKASHSLGREFSILSAAHQAGRRVPEPLAYCEDSAVIGAGFYVMAAVEGIVADSPAAAEALDGPARVRSAAALAETMADLHAVDISRDGFARIASGERYGERQVTRWQRQWGHARTRDLGEIDQLGERLETSIPRQAESTLVHGDFTIFNVVLSPAGEVRAVLDWEMSTLGDPIADLAWCSMWWPDTEAESAPGADPVPLLPGFPPRAVLIDAYAAATSRDLAALPWWQALSYWKLAIILEGILKSWEEDPANGGRNPEMLVPGVIKAVLLAEGAADRAEI